MLDPRCAYCNIREPQTQFLRCSQCKKVKYCSKSCQRKHWKLGHRHICKAKDTSVSSDTVSDRVLHTPETSTTAKDAERELYSIISQISIEDAERLYHSAHDEIKLIRENPSLYEKQFEQDFKGALNKNSLQCEKGERIRQSNVNSVNKYRKEINPIPNKDQNGTIRSKIPLSTNSLVKGTKPDIFKTKSSSMHGKTKETNCKTKNLNWPYSVEMLESVKSFSITLFFPSAQSKLDNNNGLQKIPMKDSIRLRVLPMNKSSQSVSHHATFVQVYGKILENEAIRENMTFDNFDRVGKEKLHQKQTQPKTKEIQLANFPLPSRYLRLQEDTVSSSIFDEESITFRIYYDLDKEYDEPNRHNAHITPEDANEAKCRFCNTRLLNLSSSYMDKNELRLSITRDASNKQKSQDPKSHTIIKNTIIKNVLPLASGKWDDITDYLTCYDGDAIVNFSSCAQVSSSKRGLALEDDCTISFYTDDVANVSVLAVLGYGECGDYDKIPQKKDSETVNQSAYVDDSRHYSKIFSPNNNEGQKMRNASDLSKSNLWEDSIGGATVCCNVCCSILGYAPFNAPHVYRFLKHRISFGNTFQRCNDSDYVMKVWSNESHDLSIASFIASEMVRYADTKAIFSFLVTCETSNSLKCLYLRAISWNTRMHLDGVFNVSRRESNNLKKHNTLRFKRVLKVIFGEVRDFSVHGKQLQASTNDLDWMINSQDLCCPPSFKGAVGGKNLRINLQLEEWNELFQLLQGGMKCFSKNVSEAMVAITMGIDLDLKNACESMGLSVLPLPLGE